MLFRLPLLLAIAMLGLSACNDDDNNDDSSDSGTTTTDTSDSSGNGGSSTGDNSNDNGSGGSGGTDNGSVTDNNGDNSGGSGTDGSGGDIGNAGAPMTADDELVGVSSVDSANVTQTLLTIVRSNGEIWEFEIPGIPTTSIGATLTYRNVALVFGAVSGEIIFADGTVSQINTTRRIQ
jgi:hypothetical protein